MSAKHAEKIQAARAEGLPICRIKQGRAHGSGYREGERFVFHGWPSGLVEMKSLLTDKVTWETNEFFQRLFDEEI